MAGVRGADEHAMLEHEGLHVAPVTLGPIPSTVNHLGASNFLEKTHNRSQKTQSTIKQALTSVGKEERRRETSGHGKVTPLNTLKLTKRRTPCILHVPIAILLLRMQYCSSIRLFFQTSSRSGSAGHLKRMAPAGKSVSDLFVFSSLIMDRSSWKQYW
eukprot:3002822-Pleurochrysis_carterae.AAC.1